jgi:hypothetical protein
MSSIAGLAPILLITIMIIGPVGRMVLKARCRALV